MLQINKKMLANISTNILPNKWIDLSKRVYTAGQYHSSHKYIRHIGGSSFEFHGIDNREHITDD